jgi:hypothetical protein
MIFIARSSCIETIPCTAGPYLMGRYTKIIDKILIYSRMHLSILDVQSLSVADFDTYHNLLAAKCKERLAVIKGHHISWIGKD